MPTRCLDHDGSVLLQPSVQCGREPVPHSLPDRLGVRLLPVLVGVVHDGDVRAPPSNRPAHPGGNHPAIALPQSPAVSGGRVGVHLHPEQLLPHFFHQVSRPAPPVAGKLRAVGRHDHTPVREVPQVPHGEVDAAQVALPRPRRHLNYQPLRPPSRYVHQPLRQVQQVPRRFPPTPAHLARKHRQVGAHQVFLTQHKLARQALWFLGRQ